VARDEQRLAALADELGDAEILSADLADPVQRTAVEDVARHVDWLVNNAGYGLNTSFAKSSIEDEQKLLDVLVTAPMRLTHAALPGMIARNYGRILNVSSVAGWIPFGTYSAAKAWVTTFSEGLAAETPRNIHVTALCPGFTRTEFHERAEMNVGAPDWVWLNPRGVALQGIKDCERGTVLSVPSLKYQALAQVARHAPRSLLRAAARRQGE
jgi:short-subunit dehydrogenase